jgi:hypothetical protein
MYSCFKYGIGERTSGGRFFNDYDEPSLAALVAELGTAQCIHCWQTQDLRPARVGEVWLNTLLGRIVGLNAARLC